MAKVLFKVFLGFIKSVADIILAPINLLIVGLFPDLSNLISTFNSAVSRLIGAGVGFFSYMLPSGTKTLILFYLGILISYYTVSITVHGILKVINIIKRIKIW